MNMTLFVSLLFGLQLLYWYLGKRASQGLKSEEDYFLAGKTVRLFPLLMTFLATQVGGGLVLGSAEEAYKYGWSVFLYPLGASLGLILLGLGVGKRLASFPVSTVAHILEIVYRSVFLRRAASLLSIASLFMILGGQVIASNKFLLSMGFNSTPLFILFWAIVILYTAQGGLKAVISTDIAQALFFSLIFLGCFGFVFFFGKSPVLSTPLVAMTAAPLSKLSGWLLMPFLFMVIEQDMGQRCFAGKSPKIVSRASLLAGVLTCLICSAPIFFGKLANTLQLQIVPGGSVLMAAIEATTTPLVTALVGCAILAAIISTASSLINAISSNLAADFNLSLKLRSVQTITVALSLGAIGMAFFFDNVVDILIGSYELFVSALFVPIFIALFKRKGNFISALLAMILGGGGFFFFRLVPIPFPQEIVSLGLSLLGFGVGEAICFVRDRRRVAANF